RPRPGRSDSSCPRSCLSSRPSAPSGRTPAPPVWHVLSPSRQPPQLLADPVHIHHRHLPAVDGAAELDLLLLHLVWAPAQDVPQRCGGSARRRGVGVDAEAPRRGSREVIHRPRPPLGTLLEESQQTQRLGFQVPYSAGVRAGLPRSPQLLHLPLPLVF